MVPANGSSPRMWGTRCVHSIFRWGERFIPTHVGNSFALHSILPFLTVHPHACGELIEIDLRYATYGSSPRMWGTLRSHAPFRSSDTGSSPRMWGTHIIPGIFEGTGTVHPHACGELKNPRRALSGCRFIPTHVGNSLYICINQRLMQRFIPTHVGNSIKISLSPPGVSGSSPRMWGTLFSRQVGPVHGSSPRMWGTPEKVRLNNSLIRFIPTHVGNSTRIYPRSDMELGSSPRMWGTHVSPIHSPGLNGSSPRMWGTLPTAVLRPTSPVHPHACGELFCAFSRGARCRFIPTHVGNSGVRRKFSEAVSRFIPTMWELARRETFRETPRFIPTHVGNSSPY